MLNEKTINKSVPIPLYYQLKSLILEEIKDGSYKPGDLIPTEDELGKMFDISRTTVRQAITELVNEGYVYRVKSKGTFVSEPKINRTVPGSNYSENTATFEHEIQTAGHTPKTVIREMKVIDTPSIMMEQGYHSPTGKALYMVRVRYVDDQPLEYIISYINYDFFASLMTSNELETHSMGEIMGRDEKTRIRTMVRTVEALLSSKTDMQILGVKAKTAIQLLTTVRKNKDDVLLDITLDYVRGDLGKLIFKTEMM